MLMASSIQVEFNLISLTPDRIAYSMKVGDSGATRYFIMPCPKQTKERYLTLIDNE